MWSTPVAQRLKHLPAMWEIWVQSLGGEDPLEKEMATHSSILAWRIPQMEEPAGLQSMGSQRVRHNWVTSLTFHLPWVLIGRTDVEAETQILWPPDGKNWLIWKDPDSGKDWRQEEKGMTEDEMVGWHHWLDSHEFEQAPGIGDEQGSLVCCSPWSCKKLDLTEGLNWTEWNEAS